MTREEEIKQAAQAYYPSGSLYEERTVSAFVRGAKWADENQIGMSKMRKDYELLFLIKKRELIKKACEWIKSHIKLETASYADLLDPSDIDLLVADFTTVDEMEESFLKAMEE